MTFSIILDIAIVLLVSFGIVKKVLGYINLKQHEKENAQVYKYQTTKHKIFQYVSLGLALILTFLYIYNMSLGKAKLSLTSINFILFFIYFGVLPTSTGYWALTRKGIYIYLFDRFIKWPEIIQTGWVKKKEKDSSSPYVLTLILKKEKGEFFKQTTYQCLVPAIDKEMIENFINGERRKVDTIKLRKKSRPYREELKKGKH